MSDTATDTELDEALNHHGAGRLAQAEALYRRLLEHDPEDADCLHLLGLSTVQRGQSAAGAELILRAMALAPGCAPHHNSLGLAYRALGRLEDAVCEYRAGVSLRPQSAEIHNNLATTLCDLGRREEAVAHYRLAAERAPRSAEIWYNLANALAGSGAVAEVEKCYRNAIAHDPRFVNAHANFGRWLMTEARWADAEQRLAEAARIDPAPPQLWNNLGVTLVELDRSREAEASYRRAIALDPNFAEAHYNLGCLLHLHGRTDDAIACHQAALAADPRHGAARLALCMAELPILYRTEVQVGEQRQRYAAALDRLITAAQAPEIARSLATAIGTSQPFFLPYQGENDRPLQASYGRLACRLLAEHEPAAPLAAAPAKGERIRLGIVSGYFCDHTIFKLFLEGWMRRLDRRRFEVIGFHTGRTADAETARAEIWCDRFIQHQPTAAAWRQAVSATAPHILLYPEIGMDPIAARLAAQRLAPVQCVTWGQPETTGMPTLDFFLTSDLMEPSGGEAHYTEHLVRLPHLGLCYLPDQAPVPPLDRAALGLDPDATIYWSGQALYKYLPQYDAVFPRIAAAIGACQFVFIDFAKSRAVTAVFRERVGQAFAAAGMDAERYCVFLPPMPRQRFLAAAALADVVLDTPGWSGGKSTLDCLAGDPAIVTLPGRLMRGRHTAAILRRIGGEATIVGSLDEYVDIAVRLGRDADWRTRQRQAVAQGKSRAFADMEYIRALETFLVAAVTPPCP